jgi:hypothetical protein
MTALLTTIEQVSGAKAIAGLLDILLPDARTILDMTFGKGQFWKPRAHPVPVSVTGLDLDPSRARDVRGDFRALPFANGSFDVCVFDPPYLWDVSKKRPGIMGSRFGSFETAGDARASIEAGSREAWRVARLGIIVKVQDYIHASRSWWLSRWVQDVMPVEPYDFLHLTGSRKLNDPKWKRQLSVRRRHATFWVWRMDGNVHRARRS